MKERKSAKLQPQNGHVSPFKFAKLLDPDASWDKVLFWVMFVFFCGECLVRVDLWSWFVFVRCRINYAMSCIGFGSLWVLCLVWCGEPSPWSGQNGFWCKLLSLFFPSEPIFNFPVSPFTLLRLFYHLCNITFSHYLSNYYLMLSLGDTESRKFYIEWMFYFFSKRLVADGHKKS